MNAISLIHNIDQIFIALTVTAINRCPFSFTTPEFTVFAQFGPGCGAQHQHDTRNIIHSSKQRFRSDGMPPTERMCSGSIIRDTTVADSMAPRINTTLRIVFGTRLAVWPGLHVLSVSNLNEYPGIEANCDRVLDWVLWEYTCVRIAMRRVTLPKSLLAFHLPAHNMQFCL